MNIYKKTVISLFLCFLVVLTATTASGAPETVVFRENTPLTEYAQWHPVLDDLQMFFLDMGGILSNIGKFIKPFSILPCETEYGRIVESAADVDSSGDTLRIDKREFFTKWDFEGVCLIVDLTEGAHDALDSYLLGQGYTLAELHMIMDFSIRLDSSGEEDFTELVYGGGPDEYLFGWDYREDVLLLWTPENILNSSPENPFYYDMRLEMPYEDIFADVSGYNIDLTTVVSDVRGNGVNGSDGSPHSPEPSTCVILSLFAVLTAMGRKFRIG